MGKATRGVAAATKPKPTSALKSKQAAPAKSAKPAKATAARVTAAAKQSKAPAPSRKGISAPKPTKTKIAPAKTKPVSLTRSSIVVKKSAESLPRTTKTLPLKPSAMQSPKLREEKGADTRQVNGAQHPGFEDAPVRAKPKPMNKKARSELSSISLPAGYRPSEGEPFMSPLQRVYFRNKLQTWKEDIIKQNRETLQVLHEDTLQHADLADRATSETDRALELRARDRQRKLVAKIDAAIARIDDGSYGYCEETGEPISLKRLDARPIATLSLEAQERHERRERVYRED